MSAREVSRGAAQAVAMDEDSQFALSAAWFSLGVVTPERLAAR